MKKTTTFLLTLLALSVIITCEFVNFANANPIWRANLPYKPNYSKPRFILTPIQAVYETTDSNTTLNFILNFTVTKPSGSRQAVVSLWYVLDNCSLAGHSQANGLSETKGYLNPNDKDSLFNTNRELHYTLKLPVTRGDHNLKIGLEAKSYYWDISSNREASVPISAETNLITFTIFPPPTPAPTTTPTQQTQNQPVAIPIEYALLVSLAALAVVAPILLYRRHKKQQFHS